MKRLLRFVVASAIILLFALPAMADFKMGITAYTDIGYFHRDSDRHRAIGGKPLGEDTTTAFVDIPVHSKIYGKFSNKNMGGYAEIGMGQSGTEISTTGNRLTMRKIYGFYKWGYLQLTAGQTEPLGAARYTASQLMGENESQHFLLAGWGSLYMRNPQVNLEYRRGKWYLGVGASEIVHSFDSAGNTGGVEESPVPTGDLVIGFRSKPLEMTLNGSASYNSFTGEKETADDDAKAWYVSLNTDLKLGMCQFRFHPYYGQNIANMGFAYMSPASVLFIDSDGQTHNTDMYGGFVDITIGGEPFLVHLMGGHSVAENDFFKTKNTKGKDEEQRWSWAVRGAYKVGENFTLSPEVSWYDYGLDVLGDGEDLGTEWMGGVQFQFEF
jgi:hypothetical protein